MIPVSVSQDTAGPMGRSVADVALLLTGSPAVDGRSGGRPRRWQIPPDYLTALGRMR